ncbi:hypothetical protein [Lichenibacterium dinghuense]|uniref:hypothetical protein n=1 Tax=Lichenibacterium dinghuense TaxID=2895977 RepID=UPI001F2FD563|nr:hypothetical protein [Lichenibacterium sp. 6Y81]
MTLTGQQVRDACQLLRWGRYDLQRRTALPLHVIDRVMAAETVIEATLVREIVLNDGFHRAGVEFAPEGPRLREKLA